MEMGMATYSASKLIDTTRARFPHGSMLLRVPLSFIHEQVMQAMKDRRGDPPNLDVLQPFLFWGVHGILDSRIPIGDVALLVKDQCDCYVFTVSGSGEWLPSFKPEEYYITGWRQG